MVFTNLINYCVQVIKLTNEKEEYVETGEIESAAQVIVPKSRDVRALI